MRRSPSGASAATAGGRSWSSASLPSWPTPPPSRTPTARRGPCRCSEAGCLPGRSSSGGTSSSCCGSWWERTWSRGTPTSPSCWPSCGSTQTTQKRRAGDGGRPASGLACGLQTAPPLVPATPRRQRPACPLALLPPRLAQVREPVAAFRVRVVEEEDLRSYSMFEFLDSRGAWDDFS